MAEPIVNPELPFVGEVPSGLQAGKMLRFQGVTHPDSDRFNINLATGPNAKPRDDTALHVSVRFNQGYIARNIYKGGAWGDEQGSGKLPIGQAQSFEIIILVDPQHYKIAVNGQHFCEFPHRIPYQEVSHLLVDGDVALTLISFEGIPLPGNETSSQSSQVNAEGPQGAPQFQYGPPPGAYGAPPPNYGGYAPPPPPGAEPQSQFGGIFEQAQDILAGAIKSGAAEKLLGSILSSSGQPNQQPQGYAPQNARYGIYPDLPTQDTSQIPTQPTSNSNSQDSALSNLIAGSGGTVTSGPQPTLQSGGSAAPPQNAGPLEGLLMGLLSNKTDGHVAPGPPQNAQSGGSDLLSGLLSSLVSGGNQGQNAPQTGPGGQAPPQGSQGQGSDVLSGILSSLLSPKQDQNGPQAPNQPPANAQNKSQGSDLLAGLLSSLASPSQPQQNQGPQSQTQGNNDALSNILRNLSAGGNTSNSGQPPNLPPQAPNANNPSAPQGGTDMLANLLQGFMSMAKEQHDSTRPIQETNPAAVVQNVGPPQNPQQQYGQYPHPPQQEQRGPMESLLSGLLSGGGGQQQVSNKYILIALYFTDAFIYKINNLTLLKLVERDRLEDWVRWEAFWVHWQVLFYIDRIKTKAIPSNKKLN
ncbi:hypothetical protein HUJ04_005074 [Dendroctonus ponderosae]|nr:hypothetical protein HUJ04_005074 [Dendroctonus ponderosae]KAH1007898.1 hypothetical protein HUJ04_005074 [Dendroctonus ponderosae]KAH1007899.1 hypothetical protein HUJ04_005074 [Dendroctonus ponderosae]